MFKKFKTKIAQKKKEKLEWVNWAKQNLWVGTRKQFYGKRRYFI
jgi:hypothetical protein